MIGTRIGSLAAVLAAWFWLAPAQAQLVVVETRGASFKVGQSISPQTTVTLKEGERVLLISPEGRSITLRGPFNGPAAPQAAASVDPGKALAVLVANRDARTKSVGVVRAGTDAVKTPDPWAIDITRPGPRCLREGERPELWRPDAAVAQAFVVFPSDRSWRADFAWQPGQNRMQMPDLSRFAGVTTLLVNIDQQEHALSFSRIPAEISDPFILAAWMLEKGCIQQGDALLRLLSAQLGISASPAR